MPTFQVVQQRAVMQEQRLGSIPKDAYVKNQGFQPNIPPAAERVPGDRFEVVDGIEVKGMVPARNEDGTIQVVSENATLTEEVRSPVRYGALGAVAGAAAGAGLGAAVAGVPGAIAGGVVSLLAGAALGALTVRGDEVSVVTRQAHVTEPVLTGYTWGSVDGAYVPEKPGHWWTDSGGRFHYTMPTLEHRQVGTVQIHETAHSRPGALQVAATAAGLGAAAGAGAAFALLALA